MNMNQAIEAFAAIEENLHDLPREDYIDIMDELAHRATTNADAAREDEKAANSE